MRNIRKGLIHAVRDFVRSRIRIYPLVLLEIMKNKYEDEPFINDELNDRIGWVVDDVILHDETWKEWEHDIDKQERMHLSELGRMCQNFTKSDFAAVVITAMENYPFMVLQIVAEYIVNIRKGRKNGRTEELS